MKLLIKLHYNDCKCKINYTCTLLHILPYLNWLSLWINTVNKIEACHIFAVRTKTHNEQTNMATMFILFCPPPVYVGEMFVISSVFFLKLHI